MQHKNKITEEEITEQTFTDKLANTEKVGPTNKQKKIKIQHENKNGAAHFQ